MAKGKVSNFPCDTIHSVSQSAFVDGFLTNLLKAVKCLQCQWLHCKRFSLNFFKTKWRLWISGYYSISDNVKNWFNFLLTIAIEDETNVIKTFWPKSTPTYATIDKGWCPYATANCITGGTRISSSKPITTCLSE